MRTSKFSESQIVGMLKEAEAGIPVADLLRRYGVSRATFFKWRGKYAGASVNDVKRLREWKAVLRGKHLAQARLVLKHLLTLPVRITNEPAPAWVEASRKPSAREATWTGTGWRWTCEAKPGGVLAGMAIQSERPHGDSNPGLGLERAAS